MTDQTKKPQEEQIKSDTLEEVPKNVAQASKSRGQVSAVLERHKGEIQEIINLLADPWLAIQHLERAIRIKQSLPTEINLHQFPGYEEAIKVGFLGRLQGGMTDDALRIREELGQGIDFTGEIRSAFLGRLQKGDADNAIEIRKKFGQGIDFTGEIRSEFFDYLQEGKIDDAIGIRYTFDKWSVPAGEMPQGVDFTEFEGYEEAIRAGFLNRLRNGRIDYAIEIRRELGEGIDFTDEIRADFLKYLREGSVSKALELRKELGQGVDFRLSTEYKPAFSAFCKIKYPDFGHYLTTKEADESLMKKYKNEFGAKTQNISQELLLRFESLVVSADGFMRKSMKEKVRSLGADMDKPNWGEQLTEGQKEEVGAYMDNLQAQVRAKLQTIASTEVINAYRDRNEGGMEWLEAAA